MSKNYEVTISLTKVVLVMGASSEADAKVRALEQLAAQPYGFDLTALRLNTAAQLEGARRIADAISAP